MADAKVDIVGPGELSLIAELYSQVFKPARDAGSFQRRFEGRHNPLMMVASIDERPMGFFLGFELKPDVYFAWLVGVLSDVRRAGVGSQLLEASQQWALDRGYSWMRFECQNSVRPMLHMAIAHEYDIVGIRWDPDLNTNLVIFQRELGEG